MISSLSFIAPSSPFISARSDDTLPISAFVASNLLLSSSNLLFTSQSQGINSGVSFIDPFAKLFKSSFRGQDINSCICLIKPTPIKASFYQKISFFHRFNSSLNRIHSLHAFNCNPEFIELLLHSFKLTSHISLELPQLFPDLSNHFVLDLLCNSFEICEPLHS